MPDKDFLFQENLKGRRKNSLAFSKKYKGELMSQYGQWMKSSQAMFLVSYKKMSMKEIDTLRAKARDAGNELHVVKNTLMARVFDQAGITHGENLIGTTLIGFALNDAPALAKVLTDATKNSEVFALKSGYLGTEQISVSQIKALSELPPLPVMRAKLLGLFNTPASQLVRTIAEPARGLACVVKAYSEQAAPAAA